MTDQDRREAERLADEYTDREYPKKGDGPHAYDTRMMFEVADNAFRAFEEGCAAWDEKMRETLLAECGEKRALVEYVERERKRSAKLIEALRQYANRHNWRYWNNRSVGENDAWLDFKPGHYCKDYRRLGIHIAEDAIAEYEGSGD